MTGGVEYERIDDAGLHVKVDGQAANRWTSIQS